MLQTVLSYVRRDSSGAALLPSRFLDDIPEKFKAMFVRAGPAAASSIGNIALGGNGAASGGKTAASVRVKARPFVDHDSLPVAQPRRLSAAVTVRPMLCVTHCRIRRMLCVAVRCCMHAVHAVF